MKKFLLILVLIIFIVGCSNLQVGKYKIIEMVEEGEKISSEILNNMDMELEIVSDEEAVLKTAGIEQRFRIVDNLLVDATEFKENPEEEIGIPFSIDGNKITISNGTDKMIFEKK